MNYFIEKLPNGLIRIVSRASGLSSLYNLDGSFHSGALSNLGREVQQYVQQQQ